LERNQFTFYASFYRSISRIKNKTARCAAYDAVCMYAITGDEPADLPDSAAIAFEIIKPTLDASRRKAENGSSGGKSRAEANSKQTEANCKQTEANPKQEQTESKNKNKNKNKIKNKDKCLIRAEFDSFWSVYPRKVGKDKALAAFEKIDVPVQVLIDAVIAQKGTNQWQRDNGEFIPHPATWLNGKRWEDEVKTTCNEQVGRRPDALEIAAVRRLMNENFD
jgi:hypothetical protein